MSNKMIKGGHSYKTILTDLGSPSGHLHKTWIAERVFDALDSKVLSSLSFKFIIKEQIVIYGSTAAKLKITNNSTFPSNCAEKKFWLLQNIQ